MEQAHRALSFFSELGWDGMTLRVELRLETVIDWKSSIFRNEAPSKMKQCVARFGYPEECCNVEPLLWCQSLLPSPSSPAASDHQIPDNYNHVVITTTSTTIFSYYCHHHHQIHQSILTSSSLFLLGNSHHEFVFIKNKSQKWKHHSYPYYFKNVISSWVAGSSKPALFIYLIIYSSVIFLFIH